MRGGSGAARLLDVVEGRCEQAFKTWLSQQAESGRDGVEVVAMDGFTGFKTATAEELPDAVTVLDPFHVVRLAADALDSVDDASNSPSTATAVAAPTRSMGTAGQQNDRLTGLSVSSAAPVCRAVFAE